MKWCTSIQRTENNGGIFIVASARKNHPLLRNVTEWIMQHYEMDCAMSIMSSLNQTMDEKNDNNYLINVNVWLH